ncbi:MAG: restriction endonuclease subunit S [Acidovorax defluvii]
MSEFVELPNTWAFAPLSSIADVNPRSFCPLPSAVSQPVHFVPMSAVTEEFGGIDISARRPLGDVQKGYTSFLTNDVLLAKITPCMENGKLALVPPLQDHLAFGSTEFHVLRAKDQVQPSWLAYFLSQSAFRRLARQNMTGSAGQLRVATTWLSDALIPVAPAAEQARIVAKLEELLSDLDAGVAELKAAQKKLAQYRQSLLKAAVEGALTAEWRTQHQPTETGAQLLQRILQERRARWEARQRAKFAEQGKTPPKDWQKKYPEPVQPDTTDLPELPQGWVWASVEQLGDVQLGRQRSPDKVGGVSPTPYIRAANVTEAGVDLSDVLEMDFSETEKQTFALKVGDVLLTEASGSAEHVGRPAIWKHADGLYCFQNTVLRFSPLGIGSEYAFYSFLAMQKLGVFRKLSGGVGINHLSAGKFSKLPMPLPPLVEQLALIESIEQKFALWDEQLSSINHAIKQSIAQRQNILRAAFSGQLVPQDRHDEPASALLERIRAERAARDAVKKPRGRKAQEAA